MQNSTPSLKNWLKRGFRIVISTGMATLAQIDEAVRAFESAGVERSHNSPMCLSIPNIQ